MFKNNGFQCYLMLSVTRLLRIFKETNVCVTVNFYLAWCLHVTCFCNICTVSTVWGKVFLFSTAIFHDILKFFCKTVLVILVHFYTHYYFWIFFIFCCFFFSLLRYVCIWAYCICAHTWEHSDLIFVILEKGPFSWKSACLSGKAMCCRG